MSLPERYRKLIGVQEKQVLFRESMQELDISQLPCAILFIFAAWSGASQFSFGFLNREIGKVVGVEKILLLIVNTDDKCTQEFMKSQGDCPAGNGETYWILEGKVVGKMLRISDREAEVVRNLTAHILGTD